VAYALSARDQAGGEQQSGSADKRDNQAPPIEVGDPLSPELAHDESTEKATDDADGDIARDPQGSGSDKPAGQPAGERPERHPSKNPHACFPHVTLARRHRSRRALDALRLCYLGATVASDEAGEHDEEHRADQREDDSANKAIRSHVDHEARRVVADNRANGPKQQITDDPKTLAAHELASEHADDRASENSQSQVVQR
jgi:hypothetical protein